MVYHVTTFLKKYFLLVSNKVLYLTLSFIFLTYWSHNVLLKTGQQTKSNQLNYNLSVLREKRISVAAWFRFFSYHRATENVKYLFSTWFSGHGLLVKNNQQWKTFRMVFNNAMFGNMAMFGSKKIPTFQLWRHNILYLTQYLVFSAFWSHSVLLKIGQYTKGTMTSSVSRQRGP